MASTFCIIHQKVEGDIMANKILTLKLFYKGKLLDTIEQGKDFTNKWHIGSSKYLSWQVLDDSNQFPLKFKILIKKGGYYYLNLPQGSTLTCWKNDNPVDANFLKQNGLLADSLLKLVDDMTGIVQVHPDYSIQYEFIEPVKVILTPQEAEIVKQTARPAPLAPVDRTTRVVVILALVAGIAFSIFYDLKLKPEMYREKTLSELLAEIEKIREIKPEISQLQSPSTPLATLPEKSITSEKNTGTTKSEKGKVTGKGGSSISSSTQNIFGNLGTISGTYAGGSSQSVVGAAVLSGFVTARPGVRSGSGSIGGNGSGSGTFQPGAAGFGSNSSFDPNAINRFNTANVPSIVSGTAPEGGSSMKPSGSTQYYTGSAEKLKPLAVGSFSSVPDVRAETEKIVSQSYKAPEPSKIKEPAVTIVKPSTIVAGGDIIFNQVRSRKGQIEQAYKRNAAIKKQSGSITVILDIASNGTVQATIIPNSATFTESFLKEIKTIIENWTFSVSQPTTYKFKMNLSQG